MKRQSTVGVMILLACLAGPGPANADGNNLKSYQAVLNAGLTQQHDYHRVPVGQITIMSQMSSQMEEANLETLRLPLQYLESLQQAEKDGLITLTEKNQSEMDKLLTMGARIFTATATDKLRKLIDPKESTEKWLAIPIGTMQVEEVMSEEQCKLVKATPGDQFRLVVGLVTDTPTEQVKTLGRNYGTVETQKLKFRAILQFNPFTKTYTYVVADLGKPEDPGWHSDIVAQIIGKSEE
jgi:hypothetical protein